MHAVLITISLYPAVCQLLSVSKPWAVTKTDCSAVIFQAGNTGMVPFPPPELPRPRTEPQSCSIWQAVLYTGIRGPLRLLINNGWRCIFKQIIVLIHLAQVGAFIRLYSFTDKKLEFKQKSVASRLQVQEAEIWTSIYHD